ncbi:MAG: CARDB domain-containing protein [Candidatus Peregrinibacteria bacterium]
MGARGKTILVLLLLGVVIGGYTLTTNNSNLFKGQIFDQPGDSSTETQAELPDLKAEVKAIAPDSDDGDLKASATISNLGPGRIEGGKPFKYAIYINDVEVFSNSDSYSTLEPGDSFNFEYPIPKTIYQYPLKGTLKFEVDTENSIKEQDEGNNLASVPYSY